MRRWFRLALLAVLPAIVFPQTPCGQFKSPQLTGTVITLAGSAGAFRLPGASPAASAPAVAAFCRVAATLKPSADSDIRIEVWMPARAEWNGKYLADGGDEWAGFINHGAVAAASGKEFFTAAIKLRELIIIPQLA